MDVDEVIEAREEFDSLKARKRELREQLFEVSTGLMLANFRLQRAVYGTAGDPAADAERQAAARRNAPK